MNEGGKGELRMKWLVFSDSHGNLGFMQKAVERERPERILHLGDVSRDAERLQSLCPDIPVEMVRGNCDGWYGDAPEERELSFLGQKVWMAHGHEYHVKLSVGAFTSEARSREAAVALFGHTHEPVCFREGPMWVMNPGTASGFPRATYGVIEERDGEVYCRLEVIR